MRAQLQKVLKLNPARSLFGKIFLWFWISVSTLLICAFILARLIRAEVDVAQPSEQQLNQGNRVSAFVQMSINRGLAPELALRRVANRGKWQLMLVNSSSNEVILGFPELMLPSKRPIVELASSEQIILARGPRIDFIGPFEISTASQEYKLFVGRLLRHEERRPQSWAVALIVILSIGSMLCLFLAWRLSKPLRELGAASRAFADGETQIDLSKQISRHDEIGQLATDFNAMATKIRASMQQQNMLLANVSHELRTPLTRLQLANALLQDKYFEQASLDEEDLNSKESANELTDDEYLKRYLSRIESEVQTMDKLIAQILKLSRMQNAKSGLGAMGEHAFLSISLPDALAQTIENLDFEAKARSKYLQSDSVPNIAVTIDKDALSSALENLTRNAIEYAKERVWLSCEISHTHIYIHVDDDGKGLSEQEIGRLFEPFYQAKNARDIKGQGSGLGLAIAKAAVALNGGELSAALSAKGGLRMSIALPINRAD